MSIHDINYWINVNGVSVLSIPKCGSTSCKKLANPSKAHVDITYLVGDRPHLATEPEFARRVMFWRDSVARAKSLFTETKYVRKHVFGNQLKTWSVDEYIDWLEEELSKNVRYIDPHVRPQEWFWSFGDLYKAELIPLKEMDSVVGVSERYNTKTLRVSEEWSAKQISRVRKLYAGTESELLRRGEV